MGFEGDITSCFGDFYVATQWISDTISTPAGCSNSWIFDVIFGEVGWLELCVNELCSPGTLNPDLGGIGVRKASVTY